MALNEDQAQNDVGTRTQTVIEKLPGKRKVKVWLVMLNLGELYYAKKSIFKYSNYSSYSEFEYTNAYKSAGKNCWNIELETTSFKIAKEMAVKLAADFPVSKLMIVRKVPLETQLNSGE